MTGDPVRRSVGPLMCRVGLLAVWTYLALVFLYEENVGGVRFGLAASLIAWVAGAALIVFVLRRVEDRGGSPMRLLGIGVAASSFQIAVLAADVGYGMVLNARRTALQAVLDDEQRRLDAHVWHGELFPRPYFPTDKNFRLYKPNVRLTARTFGDHYSRPMLRSRTLTDSVLELRTRTYVIGPHGLREQEPLAGTRLFALGDSFVFGNATDEGKTWTDLLGAALREPVYNMGLPGTGPRSQFQLLQYMLASHRDSMRVGHLLWMLFEANDLEDSYDDARVVPASRTSGLGVLFDGTVVQALVSAADRIKDESIVRRLVHGGITLAPRVRTKATGGAFEVDGVPIPVPLYRSARWGYRLFGEFERETKPRDYVLNHPHRPALDRTFQEMRELSQRHGFTVMVIVAPSDARLYGAQFDGFPPLSEKPHFADYVVELARAQGFGVLNLLPLLEPYARRELLYYRDDPHWNERGNAVVAELISTAINSMRPAASTVP